MSYIPINASFPQGFLQTIVESAESVRSNNIALQDYLLMGCYPGAILSRAGGAEYPDSISYDWGNDIVRLTFTRNEALVTRVLIEKSTNNGSSWDTIGQVDYTYYSNGNLASAVAS